MEKRVFEILKLQALSEDYGEVKQRLETKDETRQMFVVNESLFVIIS